MRFDTWIGYRPSQLMAPRPVVTTGPREAPDIETSSEGYASRFSGKAGHYLLSVQERYVLALLQDDRPLAGRTVLDVGGGHAQLVGPLLAQGCKISVAGSDERCTDRVRQLHGNSVPFYISDLLAIPAPDRAFDTVISIRLFSHMEDWRRLAAELCRIADRTIIIDYPTYTSLNLLGLAAFPVKKRIEKNTRMYRSYWGGEIREAFAQYGFQATQAYRQFFLPMALHRLCAGASVLQGFEERLRKLGVTNFIGNPVLLRLDRRNA